jgi:hypothetical protein
MKKTADIEKQRRYLLGKGVTRAIASNDGNIIVKPGIKITEEILRIIHEEDKLIEVTMNLRL